MSSKSITIIGSGINSFFFIKTILKKGYSINLIDLDTDTVLSNPSKIIYKNNISPKITLKNFEEKIKVHKNYNKFIYNNFDSQSALAIGGLSNVWGGTVYKFNNIELIKNNLENLNLYHYLKYLNDDNFFLKKQSSDKYFEKNISNKYDLNYNNLLLYYNNEPFSVKESIKDLIKKKKLTFFLVL